MSGAAAGMCGSFLRVQSGCGTECLRQASVKCFAVSIVGFGSGLYLNCSAAIVTSFILENLSGKLGESDI